jgi:hypothetical protein
MSEFSANSQLQWMPESLSSLIGASALLLTAVFFGTLKLFFGTAHIPTILQDYNYRKSLSERYGKMFETREGYLYHISWAKSRGENAEAESMMKDLAEFDKVKNISTLYQPIRIIL